MRENRAFAMLMGAAVMVFMFPPPTLAAKCAAGLFFLFAQRQLAAGTKNTLKRDLKGKTIVVTGASNGMGLHAAIAFAQQGADVIASTCTTAPDKAKKHALVIAKGYGADAVSAVEKRLQFVTLDLSDNTSVDAFAQHVKIQSNSVFAIVNNAATIVPKLKQAANGVEWMTQCNDVGPVRLTEQLLPLLPPNSANEFGRIVNVASGAHVGVQGKDVDKQLECPRGADAEKFNMMSRYSLTKLVNIYYTDDLAERGFVAVSMNPGGVATKVFRHIAGGVESFYPLLTLLVLKTPQEGAQTIINCVLRDDLAPGGYYTENTLRRHGKSALALTAAERERAMKWVYAATELPSAGVVKR